MHDRYIKNALLVFAHYALLVWITHAKGLLVGGMLKAVAFSGFALLLLFVIGRSANFLKTVAICFYPLPWALSSSNVCAEWVRHPHDALIPPDEPLRTLRWQRPPPPYSL